MGKPRARKAAAAAESSNALPITGDAAESDDRKIARIVHGALARHAATGAGFAKGMFADADPKLTESVAVLREKRDEVRGGDLKLVSDSLMLQAMTLDSVFTEMLRRAGNNFGVYPHAAETYMRLGLKAQAQSRATLEALAKLHQPREQTVHHRHYHVGPDGKAVFVENAYGAGANGQFSIQPHAQGAPVAALPGAHPLGNALPVTGDAERALSDARREVAGSAEGQPE